METVTVKSNDLDLMVYKFGTPNLCKEPLFFTTPGWGVSAEEYYLTLDFLFPDFQIYFIDTRGTGKSQAPSDPNDYTFGKFADDFEAIRKHFKIDKMNFVGHSFGGVLGTSFALKYPQSIGRLIILCSYIEKDKAYSDRKNALIDKMKSESWWAKVESERSNENFLDSQESLEKNVMGVLPMYFTNQEALAAALPKFLEGSVRLEPFKGILHCYPDFDVFLLEQAKRIQCEAHIICGGDDFVCPAEDNKRIHQSIAGSTYQVIEGVGHFPLG